MVEQGARPYRSPLREQQAERTRELILETLAEAVARDGLDRASIADVAQRAGVAERTVYRHFPTRQALVDGLHEWVDRLQVGRTGRLVLERPEDIPDNVTTVFRAFDAIGAPVEAATMASLQNRTPAVLRARRTEQFRSVLAGELAHLPAESAAAVQAVIRHLVSSTTWFVLRDEFHVEGGQAGETVAWVLRLVLRDLRAGGGPGTASDKEGQPATAAMGG